MSSVPVLAVSCDQTPLRSTNQVLLPPIILEAGLPTTKLEGHLHFDVHSQRIDALVDSRLPTLRKIAETISPWLCSPIPARSARSTVLLSITTRYTPTCRQVMIVMFVFSKNSIAAMLCVEEGFHVACREDILTWQSSKSLDHKLMRP